MINPTNPHTASTASTSKLTQSKIQSDSKELQAFKNAVETVQTRVLVKPLVVKAKPEIEELIRIELIKAAFREKRYWNDPEPVSPISSVGRAVCHFIEEQNCLHMQKAFEMLEQQIIEKKG